MKPNHRLVASALAALTLLPLGAAQAQQAGVTSAVNPTAQGTPPGGQPQVLRLGSNIARNERIVTSPEGLTQILFNDGSNLAVGPNAEITIDEFVYNPDQGTGRMAMTLARGVMQLTGGRILNTSEVKITGPVGTVGIRGAVAIVSATPGGAQTGALVYGKSLSMQGQTGPTQTVTQSNYSITIPGGGQPAGAPTFLTPAMLGQLSGALAPPPGSSGGAGSPPTEQGVQSAGGGLTSVVTTPATNLGLGALQPLTNTNLALVSGIAQSVSQATGVQQTFAQTATSPVIAAALFNQLLGLIGSDTLNILFTPHIRGVESSRTGTVNGVPVTVATASGENFSSLIGRQSGDVNLTFGSGGGAATIPMTVSTTAPSLRASDDVPGSTQKFSTRYFGNVLLEMLVNNSFKVIRNSNVATGSINGIAYRIELPQGSKFGSTPTTTQARLFLNNQLVAQGNIAKLNLGFKP